MDEWDKNDPFWYRIEADYHGYPYCVLYAVERETPKGVWIRCASYSERIDEPRIRWVSNEAHKRFAYPSLKEAYQSYIARKRRYIIHCERRLSTARRQFEHGRDEFEKLKIVQQERVEHEAFKLIKRMIA